MSLSTAHPVVSMLFRVSAAQGKSLQRALSDGAKRLQEGPLNGPSAALDTMSAAAKDLKQKVSSEPGVCNSSACNTQPYR